MMNIFLMLNPEGIFRPAGCWRAYKDSKFCEHIYSISEISSLTILFPSVFR